MKFVHRSTTGQASAGAVLPQKWFSVQVSKSGSPEARRSTFKVTDLNSGQAGSSCQVEAQEGLQAEGHSHLLSTLLHGLLRPSHSMVARLQEHRVDVHGIFMT